VVWFGWVRWHLRNTVPYCSLTMLFALLGLVTSSRVIHGFPSLAKRQVWGYFLHPLPSRVVSWATGEPTFHAESDCLGELADIEKSRHLITMFRPRYCAFGYARTVRSESSCLRITSAAEMNSSQLNSSQCGTVLDNTAGHRYTMRQPCPFT
jgi:hypothetical protein